MTTFPRRQIRIAFSIVLGYVTLVQSSAAAEGLVAVGHDRRIDLEWTPGADDRAGYDIYRASSERGPFQRLNQKPHRLHCFSDFFGKNDVTHFYRVTKANDTASIATSPTVSARSTAMSDDELLSSVQEATFRYFWHFGHPVSGLARERSQADRICTTGGSGFGMMAIVIGAERGFVTREAAAARTLKMVKFLDEKAQRYHGVWSHWLDGATVETLPFARKNGIAADNGGDLVETSFLVQGCLLYTSDAADDSALV